MEEILNGQALYWMNKYTDLKEERAEEMAKKDIQIEALHWQNLYLVNKIEDMKKAYEKH